MSSWRAGDVSPLFLPNSTVSRRNAAHRRDRRRDATLGGFRIDSKQRDEMSCVDRWRKCSLQASSDMSSTTCSPGPRRSSAHPQSPLEESIIMRAVIWKFGGSFVVLGLGAGLVAAQPPQEPRGVRPQGMMRNNPLMAAILSPWPRRIRVPSRRCAIAPGRSSGCSSIPRLRIRRRGRESSSASSSTSANARPTG